MRKILAAVATVVFLAVAAYAGEVEGTVKDVSRATRIIALEAGTSLVAAADVNFATMRAGNGIKIIHRGTPMPATP